MKKIIIVMVSLLFMTGCITVGDIKKEPPIMNKVVTGNYADINRCVVSSMESSSRWAVRALGYDIRVYADNKTSEIIAATHSGGIAGKIFIWRLFTKQIDENNVHVDLRGMKADTQIASEYLKACLK